MDQLFKFSQRLFLREVYKKQVDVFAFFGGKIALFL